VKQLTEGHVEWTMAAPLWRQTGDPTVAQNRVKFRTPTILRFASDAFMDEFHNLLSTEPQRLSEYVAAPETWNAPPNEPAPPDRNPCAPGELLASSRSITTMGLSVLLTVALRFSLTEQVSPVEAHLVTPPLGGPQG